MPNDSDIQFDSLSPKEKRRIERNLISLVTGKSTGYKIFGRCIILANCNRAQLVVYENENGFNDIYYQYCTKCTYRWVYASCTRDCNKYKPIHFTKLPQKVELLLGIIHRPLFELYKGIINAQTK